MEFLASRWLFTRDELLSALARRGSTSPATADSHLARWRRQGRVRRVKAGVYVRVDPDNAADRSPDYLAIASRLAPDAALAYHTALEAHGFAQSLFERLTFVTWTKTRRLRFEQRTFVPVRPRAALRGSGLEERWLETIDRAGLEVRVTTLERAVVDVLDRLDLSGGPDEVWRSCMQVTALDLTELEAYVRTLGLRGLAAKVGFFLERRADDLVVPGAMLERLRGMGPRSPVHVDRGSRSRLVSRWNLLVPEPWTAETDEVSA
jgi:predicted transcriptional regulator of viral defense system